MLNPGSRNRFNVRDQAQGSKEKGEPDPVSNHGCGKALLVQKDWGLLQIRVQRIHLKASGAIGRSLLHSLFPLRLCRLCLDGHSCRFPCWPSPPPLRHGSVGTCPAQTNAHAHALYIQLLRDVITKKRLIDVPIFCTCSKRYSGCRDSICSVPRTCHWCTEQSSTQPWSILAMKVEVHKRTAAVSCGDRSGVNSGAHLPRQCRPECARPSHRPPQRHSCPSAGHLPRRCWSRSPRPACCRRLTLSLSLQGHPGISDCQVIFAFRTSHTYEGTFL